MENFLLTGIFSVLLTIGHSDLCEGTFINLVSVTGQNPRFGLVPTGPAYDIAIANALAKFPVALQQHNTIRRYEVYQPGIFSCDDAGVQMQLVAGQVADMVEKLEGFTVLLCPGCSLEIMVLGDFAREWNVPLLASSASDQRLANKKRYPTVTAYGPVDLLSFANAAKMLMDHHSWKIATLLCDKLGKWPGLSTVYILLCSNIRMKLESQLGFYTINVIQFDSKYDTNFEAVLQTVRSQSRIVFIFTRPSVLREILITADTLNMTNGEYVFIAPESTKQPTLGDVSWHGESNATNSKDDAAAFRAFQSTITMFHPSPNLDTSGAIFDAINELSRNKYNYTLTQDEQMNDVVICAYESIGTLATILNETYTRLDNMTGRAFSHLLRNKTYDLEILEIYVDEYGMKKGDVQFLRLNKTTKLFQEAWLYSTFYKTFSETSRIASKWYGRSSAPLDAPPCGYRGEKCSENNSTILLIVILCPLGILTLSFLVALCKWRYNQIKDRNSLWWCMDAGQFEQDPSAVTFGAGGTPMSDAIARQDLILKCQFKLRMYQNHVVWTETISPTMSRENIGKQINMRKCLAAVKNLHHENVGEFYGVIAAPAMTCLVWEFGTHGSLRMLLDADDGHAKNTDLLVSMIWDILEGVDYIHSTDLHFHGSCSSLTAMLDKRFCIKLCGYGSTKMLSLLTGSNVADSNDTTKLWMAPEMLYDPTHQGSKYADMFSVALIILEMFTRCTPMDVILESETSCKHGIENLTTLRIPRIPITHEVPQKLHDVIRQSFLSSPKDRPSLKTFIQTFSQCFTKKGFVDKILSRLQKYSEDLEIKVAAQTHDLIEEQRKVDDLLKQIIPAEFVDRLRNKEVVPCESYDCATIFFSDLPEFGAICASSTPLQIISLLNTIYSTFDVTLELFDVYKVETVNDSYMVVSGLPKRNGNLHVSEIARMAIVLSNTGLISPVDRTPMYLRVGIHSGSCVAGIVGLRLPRYCLLGDTVNTASRMESHGQASRIHISSATRELLSVFQGFVMQSRGKISVKMKSMIEMSAIKRRSVTVAKNEMPDAVALSSVVLEVQRKNVKDADDILRVFGDPGKFQIIQFILLCSQFIPLAMSDLMPIFYALDPEKLIIFANNNSKNFVDANSSENFFSIKFFKSGNDCVTEGFDPNRDVFKYEYHSKQQRSIVGDMNLICGRTWMIGFATTIYYLGQIVASPGSGWLADTYGRRPVLLISNALYTVLSIALIFSKEIFSFIVLRFFIGMARQAMNSSFYVLMMEWISPQRRMSWAAIAQFPFSAGVLLLGLAAYLIEDWRYIQIVLALSNCLSLGLIWFAPESLKWLLFKNQVEKAQAICQKIGEFNGIEIGPEFLEEIEEIAKNQSIQRSKEKTFSVLDCFKTFHIRNFTFLCCFIWVAILTQYFGMMLLLSQISGNIYANYTISASLELVPRLLAVFLTYKLNNRTTMMGYFLVGGSLAIIAGVIPGNNYSESLVKTIVSFLARMSVVGCFALAYTFTSELFPIAIRNSGFGLCSIAMRVGSMIAPQIAALGNIHSFKGLPFVVIGSITLLAALATAMLPETKGMKMVTTVEEAEALGDRGSCMGRLRRISLKSCTFRLEKITKSDSNATISQDRVPP